MRDNPFCRQKWFSLTLSPKPFIWAPFLTASFLHFCKRVPKARVVHPLIKGCRSAVVGVWGPAEELSMKTRPDGSAFRRSNGAYGRQPTQPRPRNDGFHWATPRHPEKSKLTICNWFVYFTFTNFVGRSAKVNSKVQISVRLRHFDQAERVEKSPRKRHCKRPLYNFVMLSGAKCSRNFTLTRKSFCFPTK